MLRRGFLLWMVCLSLLGCNRGSSHGLTKLRIAVIPKGTTHEFWKNIHAGAIKASRELGVEVIWKGPLKEDDLKSQIDLVQRFTAQRVSGIVLAPLDSKGLRGVVKDARQNSVPVVVVDSALDSHDAASFVATVFHIGPRHGHRRDTRPDNGARSSVHVLTTSLPARQ